MCGFHRKKTFLRALVFHSLIHIVNDSDGQRDEHAIVVWADSFENIIPLCNELEEKMIKLVWRHRHVVIRSETPAGSADVSAVPSVTSNVNLTDGTATSEKEKVLPITERERTDANPIAASKPNSTWRWNWSWRVTPKAVEPPPSDPEKDGAEKSEPRPIRLYAPFYCGLAVAMSLCRGFSFCVPFVF